MNLNFDEDCFSDCKVWDQRTEMKLELMEGDSLGVSDDTPMYNPHILQLIMITLI